MGSQPRDVGPGTSALGRQPWDVSLGCQLDDEPDAAGAAFGAGAVLLDSVVVVLVSVELDEAGADDESAVVLAAAGASVDPAAPGADFLPERLSVL